MINNDPLIQEFTSTVTHFYSFLEKINKLNMLNAAVASEKWVAAVCSILLGEEFKRSSIFKANADSYDLEGGPIAIQVTSNTSADKIIKTINGFESRKHAVDHPRLYIFLLADRPNYTTTALSDAIDAVSFDFDRDEHIIGTDQLLARVADLEPGPLMRLVEVTRTYFERETADLHGRRRELEQKVAGYKDRLRTMFARVSEAKQLADKFSHRPSNRASCERVKEVLDRTELVCRRTLLVFSAIATATPSAMSWELNHLDRHALKTAGDIHDMDIHLEDLMRRMKRSWELGSMMDSMEASEKKIADLEEQLKELDMEKRSVEEEMQSLEFAMKFLAP